MIETFATVVNGFQPLTIVTKLYILDICGSSRPKVFCQKGVFRNFAKFTGKHLCQTFYFNKVTGLRPAILFKKRLWHRYFPVNFPKFLRTPFLQNTSDGCFCVCNGPGCSSTINGIIFIRLFHLWCKFRYSF